jgi:hypothetical protein
MALMLATIAEAVISERFSRPVPNVEPRAPGRAPVFDGTTVRSERDSGFGGNRWRQLSRPRSEIIRFTSVPSQHAIGPGE